MTRFRGGARDRRLLWHPAVHEAYAERCHIYLLTGEDASGEDTFSSSLNTFLHHQNISSHTIHAVYGPYDALLRVWLTQDTRLRLLRQLKQAQERAQLRIDDILEFTADEIDYSWTAPAVAVSADVVRREWDQAVRTVVAADHADAWTPDAEKTLEALRSAGLVLEVPPADGVKFYMVFSEGAKRRTQLPDLVTHQLAQDATSLGVRNTSIYFGVGFADYMLKGVAEKFSEMLPLINGLRRSGKSFGLTPWTLVVADYANETTDQGSNGETIDAVRATLPPSVSDLLNLFDADSELRKEAFALDQSDQDALALIFSEARRLLDDAQEVLRFAEILRHSLHRSRKELNQSLSFLTSIEGDLRFVLPRLLSSLVGQSWLPELRIAGREYRDLEATDEDEVSWTHEESSIANWTLMDLMMATLVASKTWSSVGERLRSALGPNWQSNIRGLVSLRNDFAHSKLVDVNRSHEFAGPWGERLKDVIKAISFQRRLELERDRIEDRGATPTPDNL